MRGRIPHTVAQGSDFFCEGLAVPGPHLHEDAVCVFFVGVTWYVSYNMILCTIGLYLFHNNGFT